MNGMFGLNGLLGFFLLVVVLLGAVAGFGSLALMSQKEQSSNFYTIKNQNQIKPVSPQNARYYKLLKEQK